MDFGADRGYGLWSKQGICFRSGVDGNREGKKQSVVVIACLDVNALHESFMIGQVFVLYFHCIRRLSNCGNVAIRNVAAIGKP